MDYKTVELKFGTMRIYERGDETLYAYETKDPIDDQVILVKKGNALVSIEAPLFRDNVEELNDYIKSLNISKSYVLLVDHVSPKDYLPKAELYSTKEAINALRSGGPKGLFDGFVKAFGDKIQNDLRDDFKEVSNDIDFDGIRLQVLPKGEEFDVVIHNFNGVYTHMLGHDVHSIIAGDGHADAIISELNGFIESGYELILTSHYVPENIEDVKTKIAYVNNIKTIADGSKSKAEFIDKVKKEYPNYSGLNYLDITASLYFKE